MFVERSFRHGVLELNVAEGPAAGPPMVMLHGVTRRWQTFRPMLSALATGWHVHALDFRGHGRSDRAPDGYCIVDYVAEAVALVESFAEPAVVYGHSLGAMVAAAVAAKVPHCTRAVVLEDPPMETMGQRMTETPLLGFFQALHEHAGSQRDPGGIAADLADVVLHVPQSGAQIRLGDVRDATTLRFMARCLRELDPEVLTPIVERRWMDDYDVANVFSRLTCPVLLVQADVLAGGMLTDDDAELITALAADVTRIRLPNVGHVVHWAETSRLMSLVLGFLESV
ncbi:MAG: alpha/beta hydrolase [Pirellulales bacterium]|nr:alpha/beta hydrolase [Planctomycetales bacterium]